MSNLFVQHPLTYKEAREFFDNNDADPNQAITLQCSAYDYRGLYLRETSQTVPTELLNGIRLSSKARFYMDQLQTTLLRAPKEQKFYFNVTPGLAAQSDFQNHGALLEILAEFNDLNPRKGAYLFVTQQIMHETDSTSATLSVLAQFSFQEPADAVRFKLTYC